MAFDLVRGKVLLFGGRTSGWQIDDGTWEWDGTSWTQLPPPVTPPADYTWLARNAIAYDSARGRVVMMRNGCETWEWDGAVWSRPTLAVEPSCIPDFFTYNDAAMTYDVSRAMAVLVRAGNETWEWDGVAWTQGATSLVPPERAYHALAYDAARERVVLFGGQDSGQGKLNDTWEYDGSTWIERISSVTPAPRIKHAMTYDAVRRQIVLFGGTGDSGDLADTWLWDGTSWSPAAVPVSPPARAYHSQAFDARRGRVVLFGGTHGASDAWEWDGSRWTQLMPMTSPIARYGPVLDYIATAGHLVMFGGSKYQAYGELNDTWTFRWEATPMEESCLGFDSDGDGLFGCADPDCYGRCAPLCSPGVTNCDPAWPHCGDGVCQGVESCRLCPGDCGACPEVCGDFFCDPGEDATSCPGDCALCGDGVRQATEQCDDGNTTAGDGCSPGCQLE